MPIDLDLHQPLPVSLHFDFGAEQPYAVGILSADLGTVVSMAAGGRVGVSGTASPAAAATAMLGGPVGSRGSLAGQAPGAVASMEGAAFLIVEGWLDAQVSAAAAFFGTVGAVAAASATLGSTAGFAGRTGAAGIVQETVSGALAASGRQGAGGPWDAALPAFGGMAAEGMWDPNAFRGPAPWTSAPYQDAPPVLIMSGAPWDYSAWLRPQEAETWRDGGPASSVVGAPHKALDRFPREEAVAYDEGTPRSSAAWVPHVGTYRRHRYARPVWEEGSDLQAQWRMPWLRLWRRRGLHWEPFESGTPAGKCWLSPWQIPGRREAGPPRWWTPWQDAKHPPWIWPWPPPTEPPGPEPQPFVPSLDLELRCLLPTPPWTGVDFSPDIQTCDRVLPRGWRPWITPKVIIVVHTIAIVTLPDGTPIPCVDVQVSTDLDSWAWRWSATAAGVDAAALAHDAREVEIRIDEAKWRGIAESYDSRRQFGQLVTSVSGRSLSAYLADPWTEPRARVESQARTAVQIAEDELYETGWTLDWDAADWLIPAGAFSYDAQTPVGAIRLIAETVGAVLQSHPWDKVILVAPRYRVPTWQIATTDPDVEIPESVVTSMSTRFQPGTLHRGVWVTGRTQGVAVRVYRSGTDGNPYAQMIVDPLITHIDAARARGTQILSAGGRRAHVTLTLPLLPDIGVVQPGSIAVVGSGAARWKGYVLAVSVSASHARGVQQTVTIDRPLETP